MGIDSIFGIGAWEFLVILIIAGIVMGPERLGQFARWLGKVTAQLQMISRGFARQLRYELDAIDETGELSGAMEDVQALRKQVDELRQELRSTANTAVNEVRQAQQESTALLQDSKRLLEDNLKEENSIAPPTMKPAPENGSEKSTGETAPSLPNIPPPPPNLPKLAEVPEDPE